MTTLALAVPLVVFVTRYFSLGLVALGFVYSMVLLGSHGTFYLHRYATHRAFRFRSPLWRFVCKNLVIKIVTEETYVISHHVHHRYTEQAGDPYNARAGWLYCFLADVNHQRIAPDLTEAGYGRLKLLIDHCGIRLNSFPQYQRWGSLCHPGFAALSYSLNWAFWYAAFYLVGGHALATALFGWAAVWAIGIRAHNYDLHAGGKDRRRDGIDFDRTNLSINQAWPGIVAGEWHNNHHLFPNSVRSGFLPTQPDISFAFIWFYRLIGGVTSWRDFKGKFYERHYLPYQAAQRAAREAARRGDAQPSAVAGEAAQTASVPSSSGAE